ncbi:hypothetical protein Tco_0699241 [Tanacetum coccineum]
MERIWKCQVAMLSPELSTHLTSDFAAITRFISHRKSRSKKLSGKCFPLTFSSTKSIDFVASSSMITLGAKALGATAPVTAAGLTVAVVGATVAGGVAAEKGMGKYVPAATDELGEDFYKLILSQEPF